MTLGPIAIFYMILTNSIMEFTRVISVSTIRYLSISVFALFCVQVVGQKSGSTITFKYYSPQSDRNLLEIKMTRKSDSCTLILKKIEAKEYEYSDEQEIFRYNEIYKEKEIGTVVFDSIWNKAASINLENITKEFLVGKDGIITFFTFGNDVSTIQIQILNVNNANPDYGEFLWIIKKILQVTDIDFRKYY